MGRLDFGLEGRVANAARQLVLILYRLRRFDGFSFGGQLVGRVGWVGEANGRFAFGR